MATTNTNQLRGIRKDVGPKGWAYYALSGMDVTLNAGQLKVIDIVNDAEAPYTEEKFWTGPDPKVNIPAGETFGPILAERNESILVDFSVGLDLTGVAGTHAGIEVGLWKQSDGFFWRFDRKVFDTDEFVFFQGARIGSQVSFQFEIVPYWENVPETPYNDILEGFGIGVNNITSANSIRLVGGNITIKHSRT